MERGNDVILILCAALVLAPICAMLVYLFIVICEDILWKISALYTRIISALRR